MWSNNSRKGGLLLKIIVGALVLLLCALTLPVLAQEGQKTTQMTMQGPSLLNPPVGKTLDLKPSAYAKEIQHC